MFGFIGSILAFIGGVIGLVVTVGGGIFAYGLARQFVRNRLRFVDGVYNPVVPWAVGFVTVLAAGIVTAILPWVGFTTALIVGSSAGIGTASGVKALKRGE